MRAYLGTYGPHFNKKLCEDAVSMMRDRNGSPVIPIDKDLLKTMLLNNGVELKHDMLYDAVFVHAMKIADDWGSSIEDEVHLARAIKDYLDDPDGYEGIAFHRWYSDICHKGIVMTWEDYL
jgi:hypothetical protein